MSKQFNTRLPDETLALINSEVERLTKLTGKKVSQANVVTMAMARWCAEAPAAPVKTKKPTRKDLVAQELAANDKTAQAVGRDDIEYGPDTELPGGDHVASLSAPAAQAPTRSMEDWRKDRKPLTRPHGSTQPKAKRN